MKILQVTSTSDFEILDVPTPEPGPGQVLLRVEGVTTCPQWDLHLRHNDPMFVGHRFDYPYTPGQPGHEATGHIEAVGEGVEGLAPGDRVSAWRDQGQHRQGCYAQYVILEAANAIRVPEDLPDEALAPVELAMCVGTVFRTLRDMSAIEGRCFGVVGLGPAGLVALQMARAEGAAEVFGFDPVQSRCEIGASLGGDGCYDPASFVVAQFPSRTEGAPRLATGVDCVGAKATVEWLMDRTADVAALFGVQREDYTYGVRHNNLTLVGYKGHSRESAEYAVSLIREGKLNLAALVSHVLPLSRYGEAIDLLERREAVKVMFRPWED